MAEGVYTLEKFKEGKDPGQTLENLDKYLKRDNLVFKTADVRTDAKNKLFLQIWGGDQMVTLFGHEGKVIDGDTFDEAVTKIKNALTAQINDIYPFYKLLWHIKDTDDSEPNETCSSDDDEMAGRVVQVREISSTRNDFTKDEELVAVFIN